MFKGRRDPEVGIVVLQNVCNPYTSKNGGSWIEVGVPPEDTGDYTNKWETMMVDRKQIDDMGDGMTNYIRVNDNADIVCSLKDAKHTVIGGETLKPIQIIGRWLKYYRWSEYNVTHPELADELNSPSLDMYNDMITIGQNMSAYMNRLPKIMPHMYQLVEDIA